MHGMCFHNGNKYKKMKRKKKPKKPNKQLQLFDKNLKPSYNWINEIKVTDAKHVKN